MENWEDLIKTLPSDETLERLEKNGTLDEFDRKLKMLQEQIDRMKERHAKENNEIEKMFQDLDDSKKAEDNSKTLN